MTDLDLQTRPCLHDGQYLGPPISPGDPRGPVPGQGGPELPLDLTEGNQSDSYARFENSTMSGFCNIFCFFRSISFDFINFVCLDVEICDSVHIVETVTFVNWKSCLKVITKTSPYKSDP